VANGLARVLARDAPSANPRRSSCGGGTPGPVGARGSLWWQVATEWSGSLLAAVAPASAALLATLVVVAVALAGPVAAFYLTHESSSAARVLAAAAASVVTVWIAERLWSRLQPLRVPAYVVMNRWGTWERNTYGVHYVVSGLVAFEAHNALLGAGFYYIVWTYLEDRGRTGLYARIRIDPEAGFGPEQADALGDEALARRSIPFEVLYRVGPF
jgi:hypothetical protein